MSAQPSGSQVATLAAVTSSVEANSDGRESLTDNLVGHVRLLLESFTGWYDELAVRRLSKQIGGLVSSSQRVMASQEDAYLAHVSATLAGRRFQPVGPVAVDDLRQGVAPEDVYERLARQYRYERSTGVDERKALDHVLTRADVMNQMDVALAARSEAEKFFTEHKVAGYRRVIHPELSKGGVCGMCIAATDRVYRKNALMPIHDRCKCGVMPILGGFDAGSALNDHDLGLGDLYENAAGGSKRTGTNVADLKRTRYAIDDHGELGPVLVPKDSGRKRKQPTTLGSQRHPDTSGN